MKNSPKKPMLSPGIVGFVLLLLATIFFWFINDDCLRAINVGNELGAIFFQDGTIQIPQGKVAEALASFGSAIHQSGGPQQAGFENFKFSQTCRSSITDAFVKLAKMNTVPSTSAMFMVDSVVALIGILMLAIGFIGRRSSRMKLAKA